MWETEADDFSTASSTSLSCDSLQMGSRAVAIATAQEAEYLCSNPASEIDLGNRASLCLCFLTCVMDIIRISTVQSY